MCPRPMQVNHHLGELPDAPARRFPPRGGNVGPGRQAAKKVGTIWQAPGKGLGSSRERKRALQPHFLS
ncbi:MAG: hypothetical protein E6J04_20600 [Chloroflexi bacterium]|nr:MAG: hypothetical protein E6J04_20600 [Chloroflexota bacterium]